MKLLRLIAALFLAVSPLLTVASPAHADYPIVVIGGEEWYVLQNEDFGLAAGQTAEYELPFQSDFVRYDIRCIQPPTDGDTVVAFVGVPDYFESDCWHQLTIPEIDDPDPTYNDSRFVDDWAEPPRTWRIKNEHETAASTVRIQIIALKSPATPTPTPAPTATEFYISATSACIPSGEALLPTPTPNPAATPTPFGTLTPSPTGTPQATPPPPRGFSSSATFDLTIAPWSSSGLAGWSSLAGPDLNAGVAMLPFTSASTVSGVGDTQATAPADALVFESANMPTPWRLATDARTASPLTVGQFAYVQVFEWRDGGLGTGAWYLAANLRVPGGWSTIMATGTPTQTVRAIALRGVMGGDINNPLGFIPQDADNSILLDNLRLGAGQNYANNPTIMRLPLCAGGGLGSAGNTKICTITTRNVDVIGQVCQKPTSLLEIGGWIGYLWCSVSAYFRFLPANQQQIADMQGRQGKLEPSGTLLELPDTVSIAQGTLDYYRGRFSGGTSAQFDWSVIWSFDWSNPLPSVPAPSYDGSAASVTCDLGDNINFSPQDRMVACVALNFVRSTPFVPVVQWLVNIGAAVMILMYIGNKWMASNA